MMNERVRNSIFNWLLIPSHIKMVMFNNGMLYDCKPSPKLFIIMGCPGVGKGTLIKRLLSEFEPMHETASEATKTLPGHKFNYIEMGAIIRKKAETCPEIKAKIDAGDLISDEEAFEIVKEHIHLTALILNFDFQ